MVKFEDLVLIVRLLTNKNAQAGVLSGDLHVDTPELLAALHACESDQDNTALTLLNPSNITLVTMGSNVHVVIGTPRPGFGLLAENIDGLLHYQGAHVKEPSHYFLLNTNYHKDDLAPPEHIVTSYRTVLGLVAMLKSCAAFLDGQEEILVFIKEGKFEVPINFGEEDLHLANRDAIASLTNAIPKGIHSEQCAAIMAEAVYELTAMLPPSIRFASLLAHAKDLNDRFEKGYKLFAAGFSYEKIRDEIEAARVEYSGKIHKVFSDIQNQLLGIPVATIIVATQMKASAGIDENFWVSVAVLVGSFIFMVLMHFLLRNQRQTLEVIGIEIKRQKMKFEKEYAAIAENFIDTFQALDDRYITQRRALYVIDIIVVAGFLLSGFFFYKMSHSVQQWISILLC